MNEHDDMEAMHYECRGFQPAGFSIDASDASRTEPDIEWLLPDGDSVLGWTSWRSDNGR